MGFSVDLNYSFKNVSMDKLLADPSKSSNVNLASSQQTIDTSYSTNSAISFNGVQNNGIETMDLSTEVNSSTNNVSTSLHNGLPNNSEATADNLVSNGQKSISSSSNVNSPSSSDTQTNVSATSQDISRASSQPSNSMSSSTNNSNSGSTNSNYQANTATSNSEIGAADINKMRDNQGNASGNNNMNSSTNVSTQTSMNGAGNQNSNTQNSTSMGNNASGENGALTPLNLGDGTSEDDGLSQKGTIIVTTVSKDGTPVEVEISLEDYRSKLEMYGLTTQDINRIIAGDVTLEILMQEIQLDTDNSRRKRIMESEYLKAYNLEFSNMDEFTAAIAANNHELSELLEEKRQVEDRELEATLNIITKLRMGESLENVLQLEIVAWKYQDKNGNICYRYDDPYIYGAVDGTQYHPMSYLDMYGNSDSYKNLKNILTEDVIDPWFRDAYTVHRWTDTESQSLFFDDLCEKASEVQKTKEIKETELNEKIEKLQQTKETYEYIQNYINAEIEYYMKNIDSYIIRTDFNQNASFASEHLETLTELRNKYGELYQYNYNYDAIPIALVTDKEELVSILSCMINGEGNIDGGDLATDSAIVQLQSTDDILAHYQKWLPFVGNSEKQVFNYIYNTQGTEAAYQYLQDISDELDTRWLANKTKEDQEFASEHPILASLASIVVTPVEGISAACYSLNSMITGEKIRRADVYSSGDIWRQQVATDIAQEYGEGLSFVYSTGMSMADSVSLIGINIATGGTASVVLSAGIMGSRAYVTTLNDALDRGLSDDKAVMLAFSSGVVETAMESFSLGHLMKLETKLGGSTAKIVERVSSNISNPILSNIAGKTTYVLAGAVSQGICEGEEEFATEILNYVADEIISGDLSAHTISIDNYISMGYTEDEARKLANTDFASQLKQAFLGGFTSGICFGSFGGITSCHKVSKNIAQQIYMEYESPATASLAQVLGNNSSNDVVEVDLSADNTAAIPKLDELTPLSEELVDNATAANVNPLILDKLNKAISDIDSFKALIKEMREYTDDTVPVGYKFAIEYKKEFINTLISSGKINKLDNIYIFELIQDPVMHRELIGTENLNNLYVKNLEYVPKLLIPELSKLSVEDFNLLMDCKTMQNYINELSPQAIGELVKQFCSADNTRWLGCDTIINKMINMNTSDFYIFLKSMGGSCTDSIKKFVNDETSDLSNYLNLLDTINNKFCTPETVLQNMKYLDLMNRIIPISMTNDAVLNRKQKITETRKIVTEKINQALKNSSAVEIIEGYDKSLYIKPDGKNSYYTLTFEIGGKEDIIELNSFNGNRMDLFRLINNQAIVTAALNGDLKIKSLIPDIVKSNLVLKEDIGLRVGLNEVDLVIDGNEHKIIVDAARSEEDINRMFPEAKSAEVRNITPLDSQNIEVDDINSVYTINYEIGGKKGKAYMVTEAQYPFSPLGANTLNINRYISNNNLVGIKNVQVEKTSAEEIKNNFPMISKYPASNHIYTNNKYGGNQSDILALLRDRFDGKTLSIIDTQKAEQLNMIIDKYFPDSTEMEKVNIATKYASSGCGYMAVSNAFATYMGSVENGVSIFKQKFGYDLVSSDNDVLSYNVESIALDMYLNYYSQQYLDAQDFINSRGSTGMGVLSFSNIVEDYFSKHGINTETKSDLGTESGNLNNNLLTSILNNPKGFNILSATNFDMKLMDLSHEKDFLDKALENSSTEDGTRKGVGGHGMLVTGLDENMNLIVSSWSRKYQFLSESIAEYNSIKKSSASAAIWTINFSIDDNIKTTKQNTETVDDSSNETYNAIDYSETKTQLLRDNFAVMQIVPYIKNAIQTMDYKYNGKGLERIEKYLLDGNANHITRDNNCRSYIRSISKDNLTKAINIIINDHQYHSVFKVKNNLSPQQALLEYNSLIDYQNNGNGFYSYNEYMAYVYDCKQKGLDYFINHQYLAMQTQLDQLQNQFTYQKKYFSLKTKQDIFSYFGSIEDKFYKQVINAIKEISSQSAKPISGYDLGKIKDINYLEYLFSKPSKNITNYLDSINYSGNKVNWNDKSKIISYIMKSPQGEFLSTLTVNEVLAIYEYTAGSGTILKYLTGHPIDQYFRIKDPIVLSNIIIGLDSAIQKYGGLKSNMILYRGDDFKKLSLWKGWSVKNAYDLLNYVGKTIPCETYLSTGVSESGSFNGEVKWIIKAPIGTKGMYVNDLSEYFSTDAEFEYIVKRGSKFRIDMVYQKGGVTYIKAKIVE